MFEAFKKFFSGAQPAPEVQPVKMEAKPIEINAPVSVVKTRLEARLERLLSIANPSDEIKAEIKRLQES